MDEIRVLVDEEIKYQIEELSTLPAGSKEKSMATNDVVALVKARNEMDKINLENEERLYRHVEEKEQREREETNKREEVKSNRIDRYIRYGLEGAAIIVPIGFSWIWMKRGFEFEKENTYTSSTYKWLYQKFKLGK